MIVARCVFDACSCLLVVFVQAAVAAVAVSTVCLVCHRFPMPLQSSDSFECYRALFWPHVVLSFLLGPVTLTMLLPWTLMAHFLLPSYPILHLVPWVFLYAVFNSCGFCMIFTAIAKWRRLLRRQKLAVSSSERRMADALFIASGALVKRSPVVMTSSISFVVVGGCDGSQHGSLRPAAVF